MIDPVTADATSQPHPTSQTSATEAARAAGAAVRQRQILDAAVHLMEHSGSEAVSMQALAQEAGVSVGLLYRYFSSKDEILLAVIVEVLQVFATEVPAAITAAGPDPIRQLAAAFATFCRATDQHRHAVALTYRESNALSAEGRAYIKKMEVETSEPLRIATRQGVEAGLIDTDDPDLVAYNLLILAHSWALKHWYLERTLNLDDYITAQLSVAIGPTIRPDIRDDYTDIFGH